MGGLARLRRRLASEERGFTLIELMVAASIGVVIVGVAFGLLDAVVRNYGKSDTRIDVAQRGRLAVDTITQRLRSQVCAGTPALNPSIVAATPNRVVFYSDTGDAGGRRLRALEYTSNEIRWITYPADSATATPTSTDILVSNVAPNNGTGLFKYYAYNAAAATSSSAQLFTELGSSATLAAADYPKVTRITVAFTAYPKNGAATDKDAADYSGDFVTRNAASPYEFSSTITDPKALEPRCR